MTRIPLKMVATAGILAVSCSPPASDGTDGGSHEDVALSDAGGEADVPDTSAGSDVDTKDDASTVDSTVGEGEHAYFEALVGRDDHHFSAALRTQAEIDTHVHGQVAEPPEVAFDETIDAARFEVSSGSGSVRQQLRVQFDRVSTGSVLFYWEGRWESGFVADGDIDGLRTQKAYQLARSGGGDNRRIEPRTRFSAVDAPHVAAVDTRVYHFSPAVGDSQPLEPQEGTFEIEPETWTRFWAYVDFDANTYSYWVADEVTAPERIHDGVGLDYSTFPDDNEGLDTFWFEHNSSQSREDGTPALSIWGRNLVVLRDLDDPVSVVESYEP